MGWFWYGLEVNQFLSSANSTNFIIIGPKEWLQVDYCRYETVLLQEPEYFSGVSFWFIFFEELIKAEFTFKQFLT